MNSIIIYTISIMVLTTASYDWTLAKQLFANMEHQQTVTNSCIEVSSEMCSQQQKKNDNDDNGWLLERREINWQLK